MDEKNLIAVYGTLRKNGQSHTLISKQEYLGSYDTDPIYDMYSFGLYPVLVEDGNTSIKMEIYEVDDSTFKIINQLKQYDEDNNSLKEYHSKLIPTPYGEAITYFTTMKVSHKSKVYSGDWLEYKKKIMKEIKNNK